MVISYIGQLPPHEFGTCDKLYFYPCQRFREERSFGNWLADFNSIVIGRKWFPNSVIQLEAQPRNAIKGKLFP